MLIVGRDQAKIRMLKKALNRTFAMKDLGPARQILGMHIIRDRSKKHLWLSQEKYVTKVLQRFNMLEAKPVGSTLPQTVDYLVTKAQRRKQRRQI